MHFQFMSLKPRYLKFKQHYVNDDNKNCESANIGVIYVITFYVGSKKRNIPFVNFYLSFDFNMLTKLYKIFFDISITTYLKEQMKNSFTKYYISHLPLYLTNFHVNSNY